MDGARLPFPFGEVGLEDVIGDCPGLVFLVDDLGASQGLGGSKGVWGGVV